MDSQKIVNLVIRILLIIFSQTFITINVDMEENKCVEWTLGVAYNFAVKVGVLVI